MQNEWITPFFLNDNQIDLNKILSDGYPQPYLDMMKPLVDSAMSDNWPKFLPYSDGRLQIYAVAQNERKLFELRRVLNAHLGSSDTNLELPIIKKARNSSEQTLLKHLPVGVIHISMLETVCKDINAQARVFDALKRVVALYKQRPDLEEHVRRPVGRILRDFFTSCHRNSGNLAEELFQELRGSGRVSQRNLLFLRFQALKAAKNWDAILDHRQLSNCLNGRLPSQMVRLFLQALAHRYGYLIDGNFSDIDLDEVRQNLSPFFPLFVKPPLIDELKEVDNEWKAWSIGAILYGVRSLDKMIPNNIDPSWISNLLAWAKLDDKEESAQTQKTITSLDPQKLDLETVKVVLQNALFVTPNETKKIVDKLSGMPEDVSNALVEFPYLNDLWKKLRKSVSKQDYGWNQWFKDIALNEKPLNDLRQLAIQDCMEWSVDNFNPDGIKKDLEKCDYDKIGDVIRDVLPLMLTWLEDREKQCNDDFWVKILEILALDEFANQQDVQLASEIIENLFLNSYSQKSYENALQAVELLLEKVRSVKSYDALLELMDLILDNPCPSPKTQKDLWLSIQQFAISKWLKLDPLLRRLTVVTAREILGKGAEEAFYDEFEQEQKQDDSQDIYPDLSGRVLAIYSLTENAALRAKKVLEGIFTGLEIKTNHDHVATTSLKNLAKTAEYFVFAAKSSKHQAFYTVSKLRDEIIYPKGKGASSIVREFVAEVC